jgi:hypothetical protein
LKLRGAFEFTVCEQPKKGARNDALAELGGQQKLPPLPDVISL